jgi:hypothetical protein
MTDLTVPCPIALEYPAKTKKNYQNDQNVI